MKTRFYKSSKFYYFLFVGIAVLQLVASVLTIIFNVSNTTRDNAISNIFLCLLAIALMSAPRYMKTKFNITFKNWVEILVLFFLFMSIILGFVQEFYITVQGFDKLVHTISGIVISLVALELVTIYAHHIERNKQQTIPILFTVLFSFAFSVTLLFLWEVYEFLADTITYIFSQNPTNMQRYLWSNTSNIFPQDYGLLDTMLDMILGTLGAAVVSITAGLFLRRTEKKQDLLDTQQQS